METFIQQPAHSWHDSSMKDDSWVEQGLKAHKGIEPLRFIIGSWRGEGRSEGAQVQGSLEVKAILDGTWLQATETLLHLETQTETVDLCFYRWHQKAESLQVLQFYEHAHLSTLLVEKTDNGFRWITGPLAPQLFFEKTDEGFRYETIAEGENTPSTHMSYIPA